MSKKKLSILNVLNTRKSKAVIGGIGVAVILAVGIGVYYSVNKDSSKEIVKEEQRQDEQVQGENVKIDETSKENEPAKEDVSANEVLPKQDIEVNEASVKEEVKKVSSVSEESNTGTKSVNKNLATNIESNQQETITKTSTNAADGRVITYKSTNFGIAFDIPASWGDNYTVKENEKNITIHMKGQKDYQSYGLLLTISTDLEFYSNGEYMNQIGDEKIKNIDGKKYLVGGPTGLTIDENEPKYNLFMSMCEDRVSIVRSLRVA